MKWTRYTHSLVHVYSDHLVKEGSHLRSSAYFSIQIEIISKWPQLGQERNLCTSILLVMALIIYELH